jgi:hypothetical protein
VFLGAVAQQHATSWRGGEPATQKTGDKRVTNNMKFFLFGKTVYW